MQPTSHRFRERYLLPLLLVSFFVSCGPGYEKYRNVPYGIFAEQLKLDLKPVDTNGRRNFLSVVVNTRCLPGNRVRTHMDKGKLCPK